MKNQSWQGAAFCTVACLTLATVAQAANTTKNENGRSYTSKGALTYNVEDDGTVGWPIYNGYRRYHADCHLCHGPDGLGSTFGPALTRSLDDMDYEQFAEVVANGKKDVSAGNYKAMPAFGDNPNIMCYAKDIYAYLKARADGAIGRGRPDKKESKTNKEAERERDCMSG